jgi:hypothetical protein
MNMFKAVKAKTVKEYLDSIGDDRRPDIKSLHLLIQKTSAKFKPWLAYNMLGYGVFKYSNYKKEIIDWPLVALASQKNYISLYICAVDKNRQESHRQTRSVAHRSNGSGDWYNLFLVGWPLNIPSDPGGQKMVPATPV